MYKKGEAVEEVEPLDHSGEGRPVIETYGRLSIHRSTEERSDCGMLGAKAREYIGRQPSLL